MKILDGFKTLPEVKDRNDEDYAVLIATMLSQNYHF